MVGVIVRLFTLLPSARNWLYTSLRRDNSTPGDTFTLASLRKPIPLSASKRHSPRSLNNSSLAFWPSHGPTTKSPFSIRTIPLLSNNMSLYSATVFYFTVFYKCYCSRITNELAARSCWRNTVTRMHMSIVFSDKCIMFSFNDIHPLH